MNRRLPVISLNVSRSAGSWLTWLLLLLAVAVPSIFLLWFMSQAVQNERLAIRQKLAEAYQGYLLLAQERLEGSWRLRADTLNAGATSNSAPAQFARVIATGLADSVILLNADGQAAYPKLTPPPAGELPNAEWSAVERLESANPALAAGLYAGLADRAPNVNEAARALQAQMRCLIRADHTAQAIQLLTGPLAEVPFHEATDLQGRLIVPNAQLMALELLDEQQSTEAMELRAQLQQWTRNYENSAMSSAQRRFLMRALQRLSPEDSVFPLLAAEDLAATALEAGLRQSLESGLSASPLPDIWQWPFADGRGVALFKTKSLLDRMHKDCASQALPDGLRLEVATPGQEPEEALASLPAGSMLPGWQLALSLDDAHLLDTATNQRVTAYRWTGVLVVAVVLVLAVLALILFRRQAALAQLRHDLVANVTHELKTPISSTRLLVDTLLNSSQLHEQTAREYLELIARENLRLSRLIDNFLLFSRIERNKYTFDFQTVPAATLVEDAALAVRKRFHVPQCHFNVQMAGDLPTVVADAEALVSVLVNLLDNAWKYSGEHKEITLSAGAQRGAVHFKVRDNGIGLSPADRKRIFRRFYRVNPHWSQPSAGCGLGLSIVQFVVTAHRGTVQVESEPDRGTTFTVTIPAADTPPTREAKS